MNEKEQEQTKSMVGIAFDEEGSAIVKPMLLNVTPEQVLLAGQFLLAMGQRMLNDYWTQQQVMEMQKEAMLASTMKNIAATKQ